MVKPLRIALALLRLTRQRVTARSRAGWRTLRARGPNAAQFWVLALLIGIASGLAALGFRKAIEGLQRLAYGTDTVMAAVHAGAIPAWWLIALPALGGLAVGLILHRFTPDGRVRAVADVIEGAALHDGRVERREGLASAVASVITLGTGGSSGREGPVVHLAGVISTAVARRIHADGLAGRDLLGCAVAAAVSASFNAPLAGAIFALEVVLRHFAVHAFAPIAIAAVAGTVINRLEFGGVTEFALPGAQGLSFYVELPAFLLLGIVSGLVAGAMMLAIFWAEDVASALARRTRLPRWLRPALAGALVGALAIPFPHVIGVGYEITTAALTGRLGLAEAVSFAAVKVVAVAITLGGRMGGGVFSPALVVGALTGLAFGLIATAVFPEQSGTATLYALAGMGAVAAAVLGAPISTSLIVFELTGDWQTAIAVLTAVSLSSAIASRLVQRSFFLTQLARRNVRLAGGPQAYLPAMLRVQNVMRPAPEADDASARPSRAALDDLVAEGAFLYRNARLDAALTLFERHRVEALPVLVPGAAGGPPELVGALYHVDALKAYNRALAATAEEEHS